MPEITKTFYAATRQEWREWLEKNHDRVKEIWLLYPKKGSGKTRVAYADAVEEALCFGWIDGVLKPVDDKVYGQRFTPRRPGTNWSELNRRRYARLLREGKVTAAGKAKPPNKRGRPATPAGTSDKVPPYISKAFRAAEPAWTNFRKLAPGYRRMYLLWINSAKREETRQKRLREAIVHLLEDAKGWLKKK
ncbi:MAG: YdeI/OmpD-associated family protein [Thermoanaerobaculia bacterium]